MKLHWLTWIVVGACLGIIFLSYALIVQYIPKSREAANYRVYADELRAEAAKMPQVQDRYDDAVRQVNEITAEWQAVVAAKTPEPGLANGGIDLTRNRLQLTVDAYAFRNAVQRAVNQQVRQGGVTVLQGPQIEFPSDDELTLVESYFNYGTLQYPVAIFEPGTVTVEGTLDQILANVRGWAEMPNYLAVTDGLTITGTAPELTGTYNLVIVAFIRADAVSPAVQAAEGGAATAPGGGGPPNIGGPGGGGPGAGGGPQIGGVSGGGDIPQGRPGL